MALTRLDTTDALDRFRTRAMQSSLGDAIMTEKKETEKAEKENSEKEKKLEQ